MTKFLDKHSNPFSVALIGNYPPSCGGVQMHISRLHQQLALSGVPTKVYTPYRSDRKPGSDINAVHLPWWSKSYLYYWGYHWFLQHGFRCNESIIHCHEQWKMAAPMLAMVLRKKKIIMTIHDQMLDFRWKTILRIDRAASRMLVQSKSVWWIAVSETVKSQLESMGIPLERISVIPAFIPPMSNGQNIETLPTKVREFVEQHSPVISTYGWMLTFDAEGRDLHSFDHCIDLIKELKADFPSIGMIICIAAVTNHDYLAELKRRIKAYGVEKNILLITEPLAEGHLLWKCSDLFLRATTTDGDSVSIREALSLRVPVVASDASLRPEGTVLFKTRDMSSLVKTVISVLKNKDHYVNSLDQISMIDTFPKILSLYQQVGEC